MKTYENDIELKRLLKSVKPDSPGRDFSSQVMNRIFEEVKVMEQVKAEPLLGRGFWIILTLFGVLMAAMVIYSLSTGAAEPSSGLLPDVDSTAVMSGYRSFFERFSALPASIAGITLAASLLVFIEKFLESKKVALS